MSTAPPPPPPPPPVDMSTRIGNRHVHPALPVVDGSPSTSPADRTLHALLSKFSSRYIPLESSPEILKRERVLDRMSTLCREWIEVACRKLDLPEDVVRNAGGGLFTSGSYRLGVHEPGADIDTIVVTPHMCTREDFFGTSATRDDEEEDDETPRRDPDSLAERIRRHPDVTNFNAVEGAAVPIVTFDWEGVNIDLLFARITKNSVPANFDIDDDSVLDGVDAATEKSLNGPRVTNLIAALVSGTEERYQCFLTVVRLVRKWAKSRGLYSNKMGYWGGVNINIAVALVIQLYPNASPGSLLRRFFLVFKSWRWPNPVMLTKPHDAQLGLQVWSAYNAMNARQVAPVITPAYPAMNSTLSVSRQTLQILHEEICRGHDILDKIWKNIKKGTASPQTNEDLLSSLIAPADFFIAYPYYLSLCIVAPTPTDLQSWAGFVESRLRKLVSDMLGKCLPLSKLQLWPKKIEACCVDKSACLLTVAQRKNCLTYFIGFKIDRLRMRGRQLNIEQQVQNFKDMELSRFHPLVNGMDVLVRSYPVKELPRVCFEGYYEGGKEEAMKKRRRMRDLDPKKIEERKAKKLKELKKKMEEMQKRKELMDQRQKEQQKEKDDQQPPIKDDDDISPEGDPTADDDPEGDPYADDDAAAQDEALLLENALDSIQNDDSTMSALGKKTREEAALDRKKLLAGELLVEGGGGDTTDEEAEDVENGPVGGGEETMGVARRAGGEGGEEEGEGETMPTAAEYERMILRNAGYVTISDDDSDDDDDDLMVNVKDLPSPPPSPSSSSRHHDDETTLQKNKIKRRKIRTAFDISFSTTFDVVELDADGNVIDKGDEDFTPSRSWIGRKGGFEFKLGERGLGYYRTGKAVVVPSNTAY